MEVEFNVRVNVPLSMSAESGGSLPAKVAEPKFPVKADPLIDVFSSVQVSVPAAADMESVVGVVVAGVVGWRILFKRLTGTLRVLDGARLMERHLPKCI